MKIFISYRRADGDYARSVVSALRARFPSASFYFDVSSGLPGEDFALRIRKEIYFSDLVVALVGKNFVRPRTTAQRTHPDHVAQEIALALANHVPILPVLEDARDFPAPGILPSEIQRFESLNAVLHARDSHGNIDAAALGSDVERTYGAMHSDAPDATSGPAGIFRRLASSLLQLGFRPTRYAALASSGPANDTAHGLALILGSAIFCALLASMLVGFDAVSDHGTGILFWYVLITVLLVLISTFSWKILSRKPEISATFLATTATCLGLIVIWWVEFLFQLMGMALSGMSARTAFEAAALEDMSFIQFQQQLVSDLSPQGMAVFLLGKMIMLGATAWYLFDYFRFQRILHNASAGRAISWALMTLTMVLASAFAVAPARATAQTFDGEQECGQKSPASQGYKLCIDTVYYSQDKANPGSVRIRVIGRLAHTLKTLRVTVKRIEIHPNQPSFAGMLRFEKIGIQFAPFIPAPKLGPPTEVKYKWKDRSQTNGMVPVNLSLNKAGMLKKDMNFSSELNLPDNYDEGQKRLLLLLWFDFAHPKGTTSAGINHYCIYEGGVCS